MPGGRKAGAAKNPWRPGRFRLSCLPGLRRDGRGAKDERGGVKAETSDGTEAKEAAGLLRLALLALLVGVLAGLVGAAFRWSLEQGDALRLALLARVAGVPLAQAAVVLGVAALAGGAAGLVRRFSPVASGSGIPHVEAVLAGQAQPARARMIPVKFLGGLMAIGGGLALGREGPSVQMGASAGHLVGRRFGLGWPDRRALIAAGAGAGLATAFNAPGAGAIFVLEELIGRFEPRIGVVALGSSVGAIVVARAMLGDAPDFAVAPLAPGTAAEQPLFLLLGLVVGVLAVLYNRGIMAALSVTGRLRVPVEWRAAGIGAVVGAVACVAPPVVGGGGGLTQAALDGHGTLMAIPALFALRFLLGAFSYAAGTPGGLFAPMLALGALAGLGFGQVAAAVAPGLSVPPQAFALVGMGAFFAGVVRAPLTGIVLVKEMTGSVSLLLPLLAGCFAAMLVAELFREPPVYTALRRRSWPDDGAAGDRGGG